MGYPMTWERVVGRNMLSGEYGELPQSDEQGRTQVNSANYVRNNVAGDMRRLEMDSRDRRHLEAYATVAGITKEQALSVLNRFFGARHPYRPSADWDNNYGTTEKQHSSVRETPEDVREAFATN